MIAPGGLRAKWKKAEFHITQRKPSRLRRPNIRRVQKAEQRFRAAENTE